MGLIESEIQNVINQREAWRKGKLKDGDFKKELSASMTLNRWVMSKILTEMKGDVKFIKQLQKQDFLDTTQAIDIGPAGIKDNEKVKCPMQDDKLILRHECLDYSGSHYDDCKGCEIGAATKNILLGEK